MKKEGWADLGLWTDRCGKVLSLPWWHTQEDAHLSGEHGHVPREPRRSAHTTGLTQSRTRRHLHE